MTPLERLAWIARLRLVGLYLSLLAVGSVLLAPFAWLLATALKSESADLFAYPPEWIPDPIVWGNFAKAWSILPFPLYIFNTFFIAITTVLITLFLCSLTGYALARMRFRGRKFILYAVLATTMVPFQVLLIPLFIVTLRLGLVDSYAGVILPVAVNAFGIFLMRQAFTTIPIDLEDAARIDGCGDFTIYARIMLPLVKPAMATLAAFTFVAQWNDFLWPLVVLKSRDLYTLQLGLASLQGVFGVNWRYISAASIIALAPTIAFFLLTQRFFTRGLAAGAVKE
ncbi:MAG: carbohydrate ABC transporter permease [Gemmatimonadetes bacterium]|jgi:putative chitobiose transport system permease protein|nr:carbohydrate ABC transporter permease [Gemmatimonadota bacterium]MBT5060433.1 carbohydrate ABC transporter permease [Gemmatimonadota bacterium]MBT5142421.1 carbohydrate ABC transporter permease [Gemmatimonadota bacterium]MBT5588201.1 carbohydrate ABC transporter permease [Gemmatimonadota bacterium]MBT5961052.1 carbohydrate ABC transporter permease [Gemmatimonadota bacterium]